MSSQIEKNSLLATCKIICFVLLLGAVGGGTYFLLQEKSPRGSQSDRWPYINEALGLRMDVPMGWQIEQKQEMGTSGNDTLDCKTQTQLKVNDHFFLVADDNGTCDSLGRGGYWGDSAADITSSEALENICQDTQATTCELKTNQHGLRYAHLHYDSVEEYGQVYKDIDEYYFFHENNAWDGIVLSDEDFIKAGLVDSDAQLAQLVESLEFWPK